MIERSNPIRKFKVIKIYKIDEKQPKNKIQLIKQKIKQFMVWSSEQKTQVHQHFLMFPNQSIYKEGVRVSYKPKKKLYELQLIKSKWLTTLKDCFSYQYEMATFYDDPIPMLKSIGYNHTRRRSKNSIIYKSLKYGIEIILSLHEKQDNSQEGKKGKIQIIQTGSFAFPIQTLLIGKIELLLKQYIKLPLQNQLLHDAMSLKNISNTIESIDTF